MFISVTLFATLLALPNVLGRARYATFYDDDICDGGHTVGFNMNAGAATKTDVGECIRESSRKSFIPGKYNEDQKKGDFCFVQFKDGDCDCIDSTRIIHIDPNADEILCETKGVEEHDSFHFEIVDAEWGCPVSGCFNKDDVVWSREGLDGSSQNGASVSSGNPSYYTGIFKRRGVRDV